MLDQIIQNYIKPKLIPVKNSKIKNIRPTRIRIKETGEFLLTFSNKTVWRRRGDAVCALWNHFEPTFNNIFRYESYGKYIAPDATVYDYIGKELIIKELKLKILTDLVEFVEVGTEQVDIK